MADSYWYIKNCDLFSQVSPDDVAWLESKSKMRKLKRGETVYLPDDSSDDILLVASGRVKICHATPEGKQSILGFIDPGEIFGELALLDSSSGREGQAEAAEKSIVVAIPKNELLAIVQKYPSIVLGVTKLIGLRRQRIERRLRNLLFRSNRDRVIHLLLELTEKYGHRSSVGVELQIRLSHQEMASIIGSTRETVTVVLGQLQSEGMLTIARRRIVLLSIDRLAAEVNEQPPKLKLSDPSLPPMKVMA
ncbi:Crp/Fnr family transcriptional regulator [Mariniblastus fucicola]|uniref:cAMP receptor protein n=1 Tax=Mariniblastus fucicola TaxID=980251 RepID=A0A5B9PBR8_9BACT|nr:Crp/Fnr family transcriptional regulator [Mariniblastus fucicola]QEG22490.1 cAMP receptor protein [Mariniblastus fucicola]